MSSHIDDEYRWAGVEDPKVLVTTSRDPSSRLKMFAKVGVKAAKLFLLRKKKASTGHAVETKLSSRLQSDANFKHCVQTECTCNMSLL